MVSAEERRVCSVFSSAAREAAAWGCQITGVDLCGLVVRQKLVAVRVHNCVCVREDLPFISPFTSLAPTLPPSRLPSSAARCCNACTPFSTPCVCALLSSSNWLSCCTTLHRWFMSVCWPPDGRPLTMGMPFCWGAPFICDACEGEGEGAERGMATLPLLSRKE